MYGVKKNIEIIIITKSAETHSTVMIIFKTAKNMFIFNP